jgi:predicted acyl esterase
LVRRRFALCGPSYPGYTAWALMMDPPPELAAAVIAVCAHHWVAHGAGAFSLEQTLSLFDGFDHVEAGLVRGVLRSVTGGRRLKPAFEELPLVRAQQTVLAGSRMRTESGSRRRMPVVGSHNRTMPSQLMEASKVCRRVPAPLDGGTKRPVSDRCRSDQPVSASGRQNRQPL